VKRKSTPQANAYAMIRRRAAAADIETKIGNHTFWVLAGHSCKGLNFSFHGERLGCESPCLKALRFPA
jgi:hypothetical protein